MFQYFTNKVLLINHNMLKADKLVMACLTIQLAIFILCVFVDFIAIYLVTTIICSQFYFHNIGRYL